LIAPLSPTLHFIASKKYSLCAYGFKISSQLTNVGEPSLLSLFIFAIIFLASVTFINAVTKANFNKCYCVLTHYDNGIQAPCTDFPLRTDLILKDSVIRSNFLTNLNYSLTSSNLCKQGCLTAIYNILNSSTTPSNIIQDFCNQDYIGNAVHLYTRFNPTATCNCLHSGYYFDKAQFCGAKFNITYDPIVPPCTSNKRDESSTNSDPAAAMVGSMTQTTTTDIQQTNDVQDQTAPFSIGCDVTSLTSCLSNLQETSVETDFSNQNCYCETTGDLTTDQLSGFSSQAIEACRTSVTSAFLCVASPCKSFLYYDCSPNMLGISD